MFWQKRGASEQSGFCKKTIQEAFKKEENGNG